MVKFNPLILALLLLPALAACGVKPSQVDAPPGKPGKPSNFPRTYPNPAE